MVKYKKNYIEYFDLIPGEFIPCEICKSKSVDFHHIKYKSRGGGDEVENVMALCRDCHIDAHNEIIKEDELTEIHLNKISANQRTY